MMKCISARSGSSGDDLISGRKKTPMREPASVGNSSCGRPAGRSTSRDTGPLGVRTALPVLAPAPEVVEGMSIIVS